MSTTTSDAWFFGGGALLDRRPSNLTISVHDSHDERRKKLRRAKQKRKDAAKRRDGRFLPRTRSFAKILKAAQRSRNFVAIAGSDCARATDRRITTDRYYDKDTHQVTVTTRGNAHYR